MRCLVKWYTKHYNGVLLVLSMLVVFFALSAHKAVDDYAEERKVHERLIYNLELFKFIALQHSCGCINHIKGETK